MPRTAFCSRTGADQLCKGLLSKERVRERCNAGTGKDSGFPSAKVRAASLLGQGEVKRCAFKTREEDQRADDLIDGVISILHGVLDVRRGSRADACRLRMRAAASARSLDRKLR